MFIGGAKSHPKRGDLTATSPKAPFFSRDLAACAGIRVEIEGNIKRMSGKSPCTC